MLLQLFIVIVSQANPTIFILFLEISICSHYLFQFWHADHIIPVYEGGGLCSLDNLRTLCVMCHNTVTNEQNRQRRKHKRIQQQREAGLGDITKFMKS